VCGGQLLLQGAWVAPQTLVPGTQDWKQGFITDVAVDKGREGWRPGGEVHQHIRSNRRAAALPALIGDAAAFRAHVRKRESRRRVRFD